MGKLDEIGEVIIDEFEKVEKHLNEFKKVSNELKAVQLKPDLTELNELVERMETNLATVTEQKNEAYKELLKRIDQAKVSPKWFQYFQVGFVAFVFIFICVIISDTKDLNKQLLESERKRNKTSQFFTAFIRSDAKIERAFDKWEPNK